MLKKTESGPAEVDYGDDEGCLVDVEESETELTNIVAPTEDERVPDFDFDESGMNPVRVVKTQRETQDQGGF